MLTNRQTKVLNSIVKLYSKYHEPVGSNTVLKDSVLDVSPATIRNDMVVLEKKGLIIKAHTSSGRLPSDKGLKYHVDYLLKEGKSKQVQWPADIEALDSFFKENIHKTNERGRLAADLLATLTSYPSFHYSGTEVHPNLQEFKLTYVDSTDLLATILTHDGDVESQLISIKFTIGRETTEKISETINDQIKDLPLNDAYQRLNLTIPIQIQQRFGYQIDFTPLIDKTRHHLKGYNYTIRNKNNFFDFIDVAKDTQATKELFDLAEGSKTMIDLLTNRKEGIELISGGVIKEGNPLDIQILTATTKEEKQKLTVGLIGPVTMSYKRIIQLLTQMLEYLST